MRLIMLLVGTILAHLFCGQPVNDTFNGTGSVDSTLILSLEINGKVTNTSAYPQTVNCISVVYGPDQHGAMNKALSFTKANVSSVRVADHPSLDFSRNSFTISLWLRASNMQIEHSSIITKGQANSEQYCIDIFQNQFRFWVRSSAGEMYTITSPVVPDNKWHKVDAVRDAESDSLYFYYDSVMVGECTAPEVLFSTAEPLTIGEGIGLSGEGVYRFTGLIDQVQIFSKAIKMLIPKKDTFVPVSDSVLLLEIENGVVNGSPYQHTIKCCSVTYGPDRRGAVNQALSFNGIDSSGVWITDNAALDFTHSSFTVSLWVNARIDQTDLPGIIAKGLEGKEQFCIDICQGRYRFFVRGNGGEVYTANSTVGPDNQWHQLNAVYDATVDSLFFYRDSLLIGTCRAPEVLLSTLEPLVIGTRQGPYGGGTCRFKGLIDQVQILRKAVRVAVSETVIPAITQPSDTMLSDTILWLGIDNSVVNTSAYTHSISFSTVAYGPDRNGSPNQALSFNGLDPVSIRIEDHESINFPAHSFTLSLLVKAMTTQQDRIGLITKGLDGSEQYCIDLYQNRFRFWVRGNNGASYVATSDVTLDTTWHKLDAVRNAEVDSLFFYCDSQLVGKCSAPDILMATAAPLVIGEEQGGAVTGNVSRFCGAIDQIQLFAKALYIVPPVSHDTVIPAAKMVLSLEIMNDVVNTSMYPQTIVPRSITYGPDRNGQANGALYFNGVDTSSVRVADHPSLNFTESSFSISMWLKPSTGQNVKNGIIAKGITEQEQFSIDIYQYRFRFWVRDSKGSEYVIDTDVAPDFQWHKFEAIYNNEIDSIYLYRDAQLIGKAKAPAKLLSTSEPLCIGEREGFPGESPYSYKGSIDQIQIFNYAIR